MGDGRWAMGDEGNLKEIPITTLSHVKTQIL